MDDVGNQVPGCDLNNLSHEDLADRQNDPDDGIDYDEIIAATQDDFLKGRFAFNSADYPTHAAGMAAMDEWIHGIVERALHGQAAGSARNAACG